VIAFALLRRQRARIGPIEASLGYWALLLFLGLVIGATQAECQMTFDKRFDEGEAAYARGDFGLALEYWKPLAQQGNMHAQYRIAKLYEEGKGTQKNSDAAEQWYLKSAQRGYWRAQSELCTRYEVREIYAEAFHWCSLAVANDESLYAVLGDFYFEGRGTRQNYEEALRWYRRSARLGYMAGFVGLGFMYRDGLGVPQNYLRAHVWFNLAASVSDIAAKAYGPARDEVARLLTKQQIVVAQQMAEKCEKSDYVDCD